MRRIDREITARQDILEIIAACDVCLLGINDLESGVPYLLPLNFGYDVENDGTLVLYFHGAADGTKYRLIDRDSRVSFEMDCCHTFYFDVPRGYCTMAYSSVIGQGVVTEITDRTMKERALQLIVDHYHTDRHFDFNNAAVDRTRVLALRVGQMTAKSRPLPK